MMQTMIRLFLWCSIDELGINIEYFFFQGVVPKAVLPGMIPNMPLPVTARSYTQVNESFPATKPTMKGEHVWNHEV